MAETLPMKCLSCRAEGKEGIILAGCFLCEDCQTAMVRSRPGDAGYEDQIERCKTIWRRQNGG